MWPNSFLCSKLVQRWILWGMPLNLIFLRHGESEGNILYRHFQDGLLSAEMIEYLRARPGWQYRLTDRGRRQVVMSGEWAKQNLRFPIHRAICSTHIRAEESAGYFSQAMGLTLPWIRDPWQSERFWGVYDAFDPELADAYREFRARLRRNPLFLAPPGGESLLNVGSRGCRRLYHTLHRECSRQNVVVACHGEVMWMHRFTLEHMTVQRFLELELSNDPRDTIPNAALIHYTRQSPYTGKVSSSYSHVRMVVPSKDEASWDWQTIQHRRFSAKELLAAADEVPQILAG